ncbi:MAG TPA: hypothetical protein DDW76_27290 [Cyanobacteria bacterium UBA11369]|nr:hypothetical protein [Cyanobacteria bacterium UBA11371]HBE31487.1 hypothetical protein [Cyanobacteria bacterium UBA11368]HBE52375.1 hypothetical protein [Cyanobacteria bacterium UBA11369]
MKQSFLSTPNLNLQLRVPYPTPDELSPARETLKHLLIGSPKTVRGGIHRLHVLGYAEAGAWSPLQPMANSREVMSILIKYIVLR